MLEKHNYISLACIYGVREIPRARGKTRIMRRNTSANSPFVLRFTPGFAKLPGLTPPSPSLTAGGVMSAIRATSQRGARWCVEQSSTFLIECASSMPMTTASLYRERPNQSPVASLGYMEDRRTVRHSEYRRN
jgi:hypothetical protein